MPLNPGRIDPRTLPQIYAWYSADAVNGFFAAQPAADAAISQWNDLSGKGNHLVQATGANQPLFRLTGGPNNYPAINFVDNTDTMQFASATVIARPITIVSVVKNTLADDNNYHAAVTFNSQRIGVGLNWGGGNFYIARDDAAAMAGGQVLGDTTTYHVLSFVAQPVGGTSRAGCDGLHDTVAGLAGTNTNANVDVGIGGAGTLAWIGLVAEAIVLTGELNGSVMFALEQSLAERWNLFTSYKLAA